MNLTIMDKIFSKFDKNSIQEDDSYLASIFNDYATIEVNNENQDTENELYLF